MKIYVFLWLEVSWVRSSSVVTERPANAFPGIIINISPNFEATYLHKSLDTIENSFIIKNFTSDNLFLKEALDLPFKSSILFKVWFQNNKWQFYLYLLLIFLWVQVNEILVFQGLCHDKTMFFDMALCITFNKCDLHVPPPLERNKCTGSTLCPLHFT